MLTHLKIPKYDVYFQEVDVILAISDEVDIVCTFVITGEVAPILNKFGLTQILTTSLSYLGIYIFYILSDGHGWLFSSLCG